MKLTAGLRHPMVPLVAVTLLVVLVTLSLLSLRALEIGERHLVPEMERKAVAVGLSVKDTVERALGHGLRLRDLEGMDQFLESYLDKSGLAYIALVDLEGRMLYAAGAAAALAGAAAEAAEIERGKEEGILARAARWIPWPGERAIDPGTEMARISRQGEYLDAAVPLGAEGEPIAWLHIGTPDEIIGAQLRENLLDIGTILLLSLLLVIELLLLVTVYSITGPLSEVRKVLSNTVAGRMEQVCRVSGPREVRRLQKALNAAILRLNKTYAELAAAGAAPRLGAAGGRTEGLTRISAFIFSPNRKPEALHQPRLIGVRLLAFLFVMAEEVARPFSPIYFGDFVSTAPFQMGREVTAGVIMAASMLTMALIMPVSGLLVDRVGPRRLFAGGALTSTLGMIGTGLALSFWDLAFWRCLAGMGYGLCFIACQGYVIEAAGRERRARGMAFFVGGIMMADMFGPAIGGILSERVGFAVTFFCGAGVAALSAVLVWRMMEPLAGRGERDMPQVRLHHLATLLGNRRFLLVALFAAVPAKLSLVGVLYYLAPLYLAQLNYSQADIGRVFMSYGLVALLALPLFSTLADRRLGYRRAVTWGGIIAAPCLLLVPSLPGLPVVLAAIALLGLGQALSISAQIPLATEICAPEIETMGQGAVLGTLRLIERTGSVAGPLLAAVLAAHYGYAWAMAIIGAIGLTAALIMGFASRGFEPVRRGA